MYRSAEHNLVGKTLWVRALARVRRALLIDDGNSGRLFYYRLIVRLIALGGLRARRSLSDFHLARGGLYMRCDWFCSSSRVCMGVFKFFMEEEEVFNCSRKLEKFGGRKEVVNT